ncbi:hypothetical protein [Leisingera sp. ANG-Vp]|uniref:hypothetical protein n=1 Tax=Leisingera sp. ANG-Vp TaxID=1577896 RepID=UPI001269C242|nr:hypothetical protein [Leisingera sp. ANG-Vp]
MRRIKLVRIGRKTGNPSAVQLLLDKTARRRHSTNPSEQERARINRRVALFRQRRTAVSGMGHLTREYRERLTVLRDGVKLAAIATEHHADELAVELHGEMPWMAAATEAVLHAMRRPVREGWPGKLRPTKAIPLPWPGCSCRRSQP